MRTWHMGVPAGEEPCGCQYDTVSGVLVRPCFRHGTSEPKLVRTHNGWLLEYGPITLFLTAEQVRSLVWDALVTPPFCRVCGCVVDLDPLFK